MLANSEWLGLCQAKRAAHLNYIGMGQQVWSRLGTSLHSPLAWIASLSRSTIEYLSLGPVCWGLG